MLRLSLVALALLAVPALAQAPPDVLDRPLDGDLRDRMTGRYELTTDGGPTLALHLFVADGALMGAIDGNDATRMLYQGDRAFRPADAPVVLLRVVEMGAWAERLAIETPDGPMAGVRVGDADGDPARSGPLFDALKAADAALFQAIFVDCDADAAVAMLAPDVEFYHDKGGLTTGAETHAAVRRQAESCPREQGLARVVDEASLLVSPIPGVGAVQTGVHRFVQATETGVARFAHVWRETPEGWRVARVLSYDHRADGAE